MPITSSSDSEAGIIEYDFDDFITYYNLDNGKSVNIPKNLLRYKEQIFGLNEFFSKPDISRRFSKYVIGINLTTGCNLRCSYCYNEKKATVNLDLRTAEDFISFIVETKAEAEVFFVDMAGSGEPLLFLDKVIAIADHCRRLSDKVFKDVIPMLATNGTLLTPRIAARLQEHSVLFGISLDGYEKLHDSQRLDAEGKGTYKRVIDQLRQIEFRKFIGGAMTFATPDVDIYRAYLNMLSLFETVSIRPARLNYDHFDFANILAGYDRFLDYLGKQITVDHNLKPLVQIINGDDYLGKLILNLMADSLFERRCEAGIARYALGPSGKIFPCSPAVFDDRLALTRADIVSGRNNAFFTQRQPKCEKCPARNLCGSDCFVLTSQHVSSGKLCDFKREMFWRALRFIGSVELYDRNIYAQITAAGTEIVGRNYADPDLKRLAVALKGEFTYSELKALRDQDHSRYRELLSRIQNRDSHVSVG